MFATTSYPFVTSIHIVAEGPSCMYQRRPVRAKREKADVGPIEEGWRNYQPFFKSAVTGEGSLMQPHGKVAAHDESLYTNRHAELSALMETQERELATLPELMKANGLSAFSLSSSPEGDNDDDLEAGNISDPTEHAASRYGTAYTTIELAPVMRRIEWERYILGCSQTTRISVERNASGGRSLRSSNRRWKAEHLQKYLPHFQRAFPELPSMDEIENNRARAAHYGQLVWSLMTPRQQLAWTKRVGPAYRYLDFADANIEREAWSDELHPIDKPQGGEYELSSGQLFDAESPFEPREFDLWPLTPFERINGILPLEAAIRRADAAHRAA